MQYPPQPPKLEIVWSKLPRTRYFQLGIEVLRQLRGDLPQRDFSRRLGYSFTQVGKWESGATQIKFGDFLQIAAVLNIPVEERFRRFFYTFEGPLNEENALRAMVKTLSLTEDEARPVAVRLQEWLKNRLRPDFWEILELLDLKPQHMIAWLSEFIDCQKIEMIRPLHDAYLFRVDAVRAHPMITFVTAALRLKIYQDLELHDESLLARHSACTVQELRDALEHLQALGLIHFDGKKYLVSPVDFRFSTIANANLRGMTKFAIDLASQRYSLTPAKTNAESNVGQSAFRALALSREGSLRARELVMKFHADLADLAAQDQGPKNNVQVLLALSFPSTSNSDK